MTREAFEAKVAAIGVVECMIDCAKEGSVHFEA
jgi:hypothetical protein